LIKWELETNDEIGVCTIQRSPTLDYWSAIADVKLSKNIDNYSYIDANVYKGFGSQTFYYRLKIVDQDGQFFYSDIKDISFSPDGSENSLVIHPNPSKDLTYFQLNGVNENTPLKILVFNKSGQLVIDQEQRYSGNLQLLVDQKSDQLDSGVYQVKIESKTGQNWFGQFAVLQ
jgi:hypothetical protein